MAASMDGKAEFIRELLKYGANINLVDGAEKSTPLQVSLVDFISQFKYKIK